LLRGVHKNESKAKAQIWLPFRRHIALPACLPASNSAADSKSEHFPSFCEKPKTYDGAFACLLCCAVLLRYRNWNVTDTSTNAAAATHKSKALNFPKNRQELEDKEKGKENLNTLTQISASVWVMKMENKIIQHGKQKTIPMMAISSSREARKEWEIVGCFRQTESFTMAERKRMVFCCSCCSQIRIYGS